MNEKVEVVGLGNAIVDLTAECRLLNLSLPKLDENRGGFFRTTEEEFALVLNSLENYTVSAGGSVANSLKAMAVEGIGCAFVGKIGHDELGDAFAGGFLAAYLRGKTLEESVMSGQRCAAKVLQIVGCHL